MGENQAFLFEICGKDLWKWQHCSKRVHVHCEMGFRSNGRKNKPPLTSRCEPNPNRRGQRKDDYVKMNSDIGIRGPENGN